MQPTAPKQPRFLDQVRRCHRVVLEKTVDNGNKLAVCTPAVAEQDGADLSPVWSSFASLLYHDARRSTHTRVVCLSSAPV